MAMDTSNGLLFESDRITDGFDIFFWVFNDASSYVATHWHTAIELMYILDGEVDVTIHNQTTVLLKGDIFLVDSKLPHSTKSINGNHAILIQLPYPFLKKYIPDVDCYTFGFDCHTDDSAIQEKLSQIRGILNQMRSVYEVNPKGAVLRFNGLLFELLYLLYHNFAQEAKTIRPKASAKRIAQLEAVLAYSDAHYNESITLSDICKVACFQEEYFCHFFKKNMGMTYFQYLNELRLSHVHQDLLSTTNSLREILEMHGFRNYKLFRRMFQEKFHVTPGEYRKEHQQIAALE